MASPLTKQEARGEVQRALSLLEDADRRLRACVIQTEADSAILSALWWAQNETKKALEAFKRA